MPRCGPLPTLPPKANLARVSVFQRASRGRELRGLVLPHGSTAQHSAQPGDPVIRRADASDLRGSMPTPFILPAVDRVIERERYQSVNILLVSSASIFPLRKTNYDSTPALSRLTLPVDSSRCSVSALGEDEQSQVFASGSGACSDEGSKPWPHPERLR